MTRKKIVVEDNELVHVKDIRIEYPINTDGNLIHRWGVFEYTDKQTGDDNTGQNRRLIDSFDRKEDAIDYYSNATAQGDTKE